MRPATIWGDTVVTTRLGSITKRYYWELSCIYLTFARTSLIKFTLCQTSIEWCTVGCCSAMEIYIQLIKPIQTIFISPSIFMAEVEEFVVISLTIIVIQRPKNSHVRRSICMACLSIVLLWCSWTSPWVYFVHFPGESYCLSPETP